MLETDVLFDTDFLTFERNSEQKHELINNELFEMSGASFKHNFIAKNLMVFLNILFDVKGNLYQFEK